jgi:hypothetical protein
MEMTTFARLGLEIRHFREQKIRLDQIARRAISFERSYLFWPGKHFLKDRLLGRLRELLLERLRIGAAHETVAQELIAGCDLSPDVERASAAFQKSDDFLLHRVIEAVKRRNEIHPKGMGAGLQPPSCTATRLITTAPGLRLLIVLVLF